MFGTKDPKAVVSIRPSFCDLSKRKWRRRIFVHFDFPKRFVRDEGRIKAIFDKPVFNFSFFPPILLSLKTCLSLPWTSSYSRKRFLCVCVLQLEHCHYVITCSLCLWLHSISTLLASCLMLILLSGFVVRDGPRKQSAKDGSLNQPSLIKVPSKWL